MINLNKVTSGYDAELVLGESFFWGILRVLFRADVIQSYYTKSFMGYDLSVSWLLHEDTRFGPLTDDLLLVYVNFGFDIETPLGKISLDEVEIGMKFNFYKGESGKLWVAGQVWELDIPELSARIPPPLRIYEDDLEEIIRENLTFDEETDLAGNLVDLFDLKTYEETDFPPSAVGLYFNFPFAQKPDGSLYPPRGSIGNAQCILPSKDHGVAIALRGEIYDMLATHVKNGFAEVENGQTYYPIYQDKENKSGKLGTIKGVHVYPWSYPILSLSQWQNPSEIFELMHSEPEEALFLVVTARWNQYGFEGDAMVRNQI